MLSIRANRVIYHAQNIRIPVKIPYLTERRVRVLSTNSNISLVFCTHLNERVSPDQIRFCRFFCPLVSATIPNQPMRVRQRFRSFSQIVIIIVSQRRKINKIRFKLRTL
uniref:Uncharacterized protein n=1 Tax=uncultured marine virus TaxID=186617 RepID=A0A0F7L2S7_9VIRU|nr:hypothetical protein [uncultured marine virus]